jgi:hypothetical protein
MQMRTAFSTIPKPPLDHGILGLILPNLWSVSVAIELSQNPIITQLEEDLLGSFGSFPEQIYLISVGGDKYACNNAELKDNQVVNGLACFPGEVDANHYMGMLAGLTGSVVQKSFEEAREIAKSKPILDALFLFNLGQIVEVHFVR